jgi:hypothetical protein
MWSDLHFGDHTRTLGLSNARVRPSFLRDVAKKSDEVLSQKSGDQFDHDRRDVTWMMVKRLGYLQMAEELTRVLVSFNSARFIYPHYINHYIQMIPPFLWLKFPLRWLKSLAPSWLAKVSKLCTTGNTGSWGCFFSQKKWRYR